MATCRSCVTLWVNCYWRNAMYSLSPHLSQSAGTSTVRWVVTTHYCTGWGWLGDGFIYSSKAFESAVTQVASSVVLITK